MTRTTKAPPWQTDILACYPALINRLECVEGIKKVMGAKDLNAISSSKAHIPLDGSVYVVYDGLTPTSTNDNNRGQTMVIGFSVILVMRNYTPTPTLQTRTQSSVNANKKTLGQIQTAIMVALQGYEPREITEDGKDGDYLTTSAFKQTNAMSIRYEDGFAYFPMRFTAEVAVITDND